MNVTKLSEPVVVFPTYHGGKAVAVVGHFTSPEIRTEISIMRYTVGSGVIECIGKCIAPMEKTLNIVIEKDLNYNDLVFAKQEVFLEHNSLISTENPDPTKIPKTEAMPHQLPDPIISTPLYICAKKIGVGKIVNGAMVEVFVNEDSVFKGPIGTPNMVVSLRKQLGPNDKVYAKQWFPDTPPSESRDEYPVPYPEQKLPKPTILKPLFECAPSFEVEGLVRGATLYIYERPKDKNKPQEEQLITRKVADGPVESVEIEGKLKRGKSISADQELCSKADRSPRSDWEDVEDIGKFITTTEYKPTFSLSINAGDSIVLVKGVHESTVRILANGQDIGGGTIYGETPCKIEGTLPRAKIEIIQSFDCLNRDWEVKSDPVRTDDRVIKLNKDNYDSETKSSPLLMMVGFYQKFRCPVPNMLAKLAIEYAGRARIAMVYTWDYSEINFSKRPFFIFYENGKMIKDPKNPTKDLVIYKDNQYDYDLQNIERELRKMLDYLINRN